jgi:hypothetical protein
MWRSVNVPGIGFLSTIDAKLSEEQSVGRIKFPDLRRSDRLLIVSDYAGDHESSKFETYSYLIFSHTAWKKWEARRRLIRRPIDLTKRRISYERLCDKERQRVLPLLLLAAGSVEGLSLTIVISKSAGSLFVRSDSAQAAALRERLVYGSPRFGSGLFVLQPSPDYSSLVSLRPVKTSFGSRTKIRFHRTKNVSTD